MHTTIWFPDGELAVEDGFSTVAQAVRDGKPFEARPLSGAQQLLVNPAFVMRVTSDEGRTRRPPEGPVTPGLGERYRPGEAD